MNICENDEQAMGMVEVLAADSDGQCPLDEGGPSYNSFIFPPRAVVAVQAVAALRKGDGIRSVKQQSTSGGHGQRGNTINNGGTELLQLNTTIDAGGGGTMKGDGGG